MPMSTLPIRLDDDIVKRFNEASDAEKARWEEAFNLWWRVYFLPESRQKLEATVDYFRKKSIERGLTQEVLDEILKNEKGRV